MGWFGPSGSCGCCQKCGGQCGEIVYASYDIELLGDTGGCGSGATVAIGDTLDSIFNIRRIPAFEECQYFDTFSVACSGYGILSVQYQVTITWTPPNEYTVRVRANFSDSLGGFETYIYEKTFEITDCDELLTPIDLDFVSVAGGLAAVNITGIRWNLNL